ncbi:LIRP-like isoform X1 [Agrilus planipennis]|uniref:LIRP-like isoform X1 n=1 Tax=Agrilus planipennis TaxID=224129 RepID=A0A1W4XIC8_AGRPL|nr:LIRP-like isoform X1 [Agrilus planipennis]
MKFFSLLLCIIVMVWCCQKTSADSAQSISIATDGLTEERMKNIKGVYCGSRLSGTISMICNYGGRIKRTNGGGYDGNGFSNSLENARIFDTKSVRLPLLPKELAHLMFPKKYEKRIPGAQFQTRIRAVDECCKKSCSLWELSSYCD